ncbi:hypothetical protein BH11PLA1_BH11PLA1_24350 [soil metagenome]
MSIKALPPIMRWVIILMGSLLYVVSPIDFIPDFIPVLGWLDDLPFAAAAVFAFIKLTRAIYQRRKAQQAAGGAGAADDSEPGRRGVKPIPARS